MPVEVILPKVDMDMATGKISRWLVAEGAAVKQGEPLFEIETDKAAMEVEAPASGTLHDVTGKEGMEVPVGLAVAWIYSEGEAHNGSGKTQQQASEPATVETAPAAAELSAAPSFAPVRADALPLGIRATPLARRLARQRNIDLAKLTGSGPRGRIQSKDIMAAAGFVEAKAPAAPPFEAGSYDLVPHDSMRKAIARRLTESKQTIPHFYLSADIAIDNLLALRERLNLQAPKTKEGKPAWKVSVNDFVIKALAMALIKVPDANASWTESAMVKHKHADIGVAVAIPGGLITPVVRKAESKGLARISAEMKDYAARARARKLSPHEYQGGSSAVSNLGMMGIKNFSAIINPPHATIIAVGAGERRAVVRGNAIVIERQMSVTLSADHRVVDGALGAELLGAFKLYIEEPGLMLV